MLMGLLRKVMGTINSSHELCGMMTKSFQRFLLIFWTALLAPLVAAYCMGMAMAIFSAGYVGNHGEANAYMVLFCFGALGCWPMARLAQRKLPVFALSVAMLGLGSNLFICFVLAAYSFPNVQSVDWGLGLLLLVIGCASLSLALCAWMVGQIIRLGYLFKVPSTEAAIATTES